MSGDCGEGEDWATGLEFGTLRPELWRSGEHSFDFRHSLYTIFAMAFEQSKGLSTLKLDDFSRRRPDFICFAFQLDSPSCAISYIGDTIEMDEDRFPCRSENLHAQVKADGRVEEELENHRVKDVCMLGTQMPHRRASSVKSAGPEKSIIVVGHRTRSYFDNRYVIKEYTHTRHGPMMPVPRTGYSGRREAADVLLSRGSAKVDCEE